MIPIAPNQIQTKHVLRKQNSQKDLAGDKSPTSVSSSKRQSSFLNLQMQQFDFGKAFDEASD